MLAATPTDSGIACRRTCDRSEREARYRPCARRAPARRGRAFRRHRPRETAAPRNLPANPDDPLLLPLRSPRNLNNDAVKLTPVSIRFGESLGNFDTGVNLRRNKLPGCAAGPRLREQLART